MHSPRPAARPGVSVVPSWLPCAVLLAAATGCSDVTALPGVDAGVDVPGTGAGDGGFPTGDPDVPTPGVTDAVEPQPDAAPPAPDVVEPDTAEPEPDVVPPPPEEGAFGWPCVTNDDCNSGYCVVTAAGKVCTSTCDVECPPGYTCRQAAAGDPVFVCLPTWLHLCDPCSETSDCTAGQTDLGHYCLDRGAEGRFCGGRCDPGGACPLGYACEDVEIAPGTLEPQCVPESGACSCSPLAVQLQLSTECDVVTEFGSCAGTRACGPDGLGACSGATPEAESCNGLDDDCDGQTDELDGTICESVNRFGSCSGVASCGAGGVEVCTAPDAKPEQCNGLDDDCNGATDDGYLDTDGDTVANCVDEDDDNDGVADPQDACPLDYDPGQENFDGDTLGDVCDGDDDNDGVADPVDCAPFDPKVFGTALETCDGVDNDCDGQTDEQLCDDGNVCTQDGCAGDGGCLNQPLTGPACNDGTVCTLTDVCQAGVCTGQNALNCSDGDPCTLDQCNAVTGCSWTDIPGQAETCNGLDDDCDGETDEQLCDDGNPCTNDSCLANGTCLNAPANGAPCTDGSVCTQTDTCLNGECVGAGALACDDGNVCTTDGCDAASGCTATKNTAPCDDGNACTVGDACLNGFCAAGAPADCDDGNPCTLDYCQPSIGCVNTAQNNVACDYPGGAPACNNPVCINGQCLLTNAFNGSACDYPGSTPTCKSATCQSGQCVLGNAPNGSGCGTTNADCPVGQCQGGSCLVKPGQTCDYDPGLCEGDVPGLCTSAGECIPAYNSSCVCSGCAGICVCCTLFSLPFSFCFEF